MDELLVATEAQLLESHGFRSKPQMQRLLKYLIKHSYDNNETALQQKEIAIECLGRTSDFIPSQDPIVRIEAVRLRKLLDAFYEDSQQTLPYRMSLPKGSYRIRFSRNEDNTLTSGIGLLLVCQAPKHASKSTLTLMSKIRHTLSDRLSCFHHLELMVEHLPKHQVAQKGSIHFLAEKQHDYVLRVEVVDDRQGGCLVSSVLIHRISQEILWSNSTLVSANNRTESLEVFYKNLVRSLVADSFGLLGQHWSNFTTQEGLDSLPSQQRSWAYLIGLVKKPSAKLAKNYLDFLNIRLRKYPQDYIAYAGYSHLAFYDLVFNFGLMDESLDERCERLLKIVGEHPTYDFFTVLLGVYCFMAGKYKDAKVYLETGVRLNPYNTCWGFFYGGVLFFMGEREKGISVINECNKDFGDSHALPGYYLLPEFLYHLDQEDPQKVLQMGMKLGLSTEQWSDIGALKSHPDLLEYCWRAVKPALLQP
ncbi:tetratricopeptide repeat protein [Leucothrix arctica]|uniref:Tetratricopeptide repeat protein n=1 Tax=Leucothrix arctica TaxID=1481894 RepID=A0A317CAB1_9GAMM|nr:hypothetical protein [Leucothrix arctica]PWQ94273.1 hypothetical protein DKT75_16055 [Leucothrix arctica]